MFTHIVCSLKYETEYSDQSKIKLSPTCQIHHYHGQRHQQRLKVLKEPDQENYNRRIKQDDNDGCSEVMPGVSHGSHIHSNIALLLPQGKRPPAP
jgi:hypothetical protein